MIKWLAIALVLSFGCKKDASQGSGDPGKGSAAAAEPSEGAGSADRAQHRHQRMVDMRDKLDADHDGKLTPAELGAAEGRLKFDDPAAVDTDHDGNITVEELETAVKARWHRGGSGGPGSGHPGNSDDDHGSN